jgi:uncharacterized protein (DUF1800 family)
MRKYIQSLSLIAILFIGEVTLSSFYGDPQSGSKSYRFPYQKAGLTEQQAAAHLLSRFSFGATPGQVEEVAKIGVEKWFAKQLSGNIEDKQIEERLAQYPSLKMTTDQIVHTYPKAGQVLKMAIKNGDIEKDSVDKYKRDYKKDVRQYMEENGLKQRADLMKDLVAQKILRAAYSKNQLREVMTDFWFNHFNVAVSKGEVQQFVMPYERDVIRPNTIAKFETLLLATAKSPAMLIYLDNNKSSVNNENMTGGQAMVKRKVDEMMDSYADTSMQKKAAIEKIKKARVQGLNENYAREIMELHTLGVDGGYSQTDVTQAARVLTGWGVHPKLGYNPQAANKMPNENRLTKLGFVYDDNFFFAANKHDKGEKKVLGHIYPSGGGYEEGVRLIHILATHPSTAKFISKKLAVRFVSDNPPQSLVDKMAKTFLEKDGDIKEVLTTMVSSPEFWSKEAIREKTKSPFELAISTVRNTNASVEAPFQLYQWITKMGQKMYNYQAPTGFPDKGQYWINSGSLLNRMNFGLAFASGRIPGVKVNLLALNNNHEPESAQSALKIYSKLLLPERNVDETVKRLEPMLTDPELAQKIDNAAGQTARAKQAMQENVEMMMEGARQNKAEGTISKKLNGKKENYGQLQYATGNNTMLAQVTGIIIGSPEFQRR